MDVKLPWQKSDGDGADSTDPAKQSADSGGSTKVTGGAAVDNPVGSASGEEPIKYPKGYTPPKGRATPTRREQEIERGVIRDPNAMSAAQASQRRKELKKSMSKEEWKEYKKQEREQTRERNRLHQERMAAGDERYLPVNDRGEEKRFVRDWVDSRRFLAEWVMPGTFILLMIMVVGTFAPAVASASSIVGMIFILYLLVEGIIIGRGANRAVRNRFPGTTQAGFGMGFYAFSRASQPRRWRTPRPRVNRGDTV